MKKGWGFEVRDMDTKVLPQDDFLSLCEWRVAEEEPCPGQ